MVLNGRLCEAEAGAGMRTLTKYAGLDDGGREGRSPENEAPATPDAPQAEGAVCEQCVDGQRPGTKNQASDASALPSAAMALFLHQHHARRMSDLSTLGPLVMIRSRNNSAKV